MCNICGKMITKGGEFRWFQYDNGEQTRDYCCASCIKMHDKLVEGK